MQNQPKPPELNLSKADLAAIERDAQYVNPEQLMTAALFAKQLQADITGIKRAAVGEGLKVSNVDMSKVMPSNIYKTFRPVPGQGMPRPQPPPAPAEVPMPVQEAMVPPVMAVPPQYVQPQTSVNNNPNQLELDFDKKARYIEVVQALEKLDKDITLLTEKISLLDEKINEIHKLVDKKKLKKAQQAQQSDGTQTG